MVTTLDQQTALVLIDLQIGITGLPLFKPASEVISKAAELVAAFRHKNLPVVYVNVNPFQGKFQPTRVEENALHTTEEGAKLALEAMQASRFFDIVPQLEVLVQDLQVTKTKWNAFFGTDLHTELQKRNVTGIVLAGIATSIGVEGTARAAHEWGYNITFANDALSDFHEVAHAHSLTTIFPRIGEIDETSAIIAKVAAL